MPDPTLSSSAPAQGTSTPIGGAPQTHADAIAAMRALPPNERKSAAARMLREARTAPATTPAPTNAPEPTPAQPAPVGQSEPPPVEDNGADPAALPEPEPGATDEPTLPSPERFADPSEIVYLDDDGQPVTRQEAKDARLRRADYTQKTQALAEHERLIQQGAQALTQIFRDLNSAEPLVAPKPPSLDLARSDPLAYIAAKAEFDHSHGEYQAKVAQRHQLLQQAEKAAEATQNRQREEWVKEQESKLLSSVPSWKTEAKRTQGEAAIIKYAATRGIQLTQAEVRSMDYRHTLVLLDAARASARAPQQNGQAAAPQASASEARRAGSLTGNPGIASSADRRAIVNEARETRSGARRFELGKMLLAGRSSQR